MPLGLEENRGIIKREIPIETLGYGCGHKLRGRLKGIERPAFRIGANECRRLARREGDGETV